MPGWLSFLSGGLGCGGRPGIPFPKSMKLRSIAGMIAARVLATIGLKSAQPVTTVHIGAQPKDRFRNMPPPPPTPVDLGMLLPISQPSGFYYGPASNQRKTRKARRQSFANGNKKAFR